MVFSGDVTGTPRGTKLIKNAPKFKAESWSNLGLNALSWCLCQFWICFLNRPCTPMRKQSHYDYQHITPWGDAYLTRGRGRFPAWFLCQEKSSQSYKFFRLAYSDIKIESTLLSSILLHLEFFLKSRFGKILLQALIDVPLVSVILPPFVLYLVTLSALLHISFCHSFGWMRW